MAKLFNLHVSKTQMKFEVPIFKQRTEKNLSNCRTDGENKIPVLIFVAKFGMSQISKV